jgi:hypothetical protein
MSTAANSTFGWSSCAVRTESKHRRDGDYTDAAGSQWHYLKATSSGSIDAVVCPEFTLFAADTFTSLSRICELSQSTRRVVASPLCSVHWQYTSCEFAHEQGTSLTYIVVIVVVFIVVCNELSYAMLSLSDIS